MTPAQIAEAQKLACGWKPTTQPTKFIRSFWRANHFDRPQAQQFQVMHA